MGMQFNNSLGVTCGEGRGDGLETIEVTESMQLPPKEEVARTLLERGSVYVHLDPRRDGVVVPEWLRRQPQLVLQFGHDMPIPIPDLSVGELALSGTLSFQRSPFHCDVPWSAVFALMGEEGEGMVWPSDLPQELATEVRREVERRGERPGGPAEVTALDQARGTTLRTKRDGKRVSKRGKVELPPYLKVIK
jgi:hypothetical protein